MCRMVLREFNIPLCYEKLPRLRKNNFQNFFKKFSIFWILPWQNLNVPLFPKYSHDHQKFFSRILVGNFTISQFWCLFFWSLPFGWSWAIYSVYCPGAWWSFALICCGLPAYCTNAGYTAAPVWRPDLSPCSGRWNQGALLRVPFLLICPCVAAEFQSAQIKGHQMRIFAPVNA